MVARPSLLQLVVSVALAVTAVVWISDPAGVRDLVQLYFGTPHERYAASLRRGDAGATSAGRIWLESAERSLAHPARITLPEDRRLSVTRNDPKASTFVMTVRRGQRYIADVRVDGQVEPVFVDVFERDGSGVLRHVANRAPGDAVVNMEVRADTDYILRVQPEMFRSGEMTVAVRTEPTLQIPVEGATAKNVQSFFGADRDGGRRAHHGVDIFAARRTPVRAAAAGIVTSVGTNGLGGNVVWITRPTRAESHYYAHLDRQLVTPGTYVKAGDVIGLVGNTGNARGTTPHLHFGIYTAGGAVDPLPYISAPPGRKTARKTTKAPAAGE
jgi:murein DD-endopeptidase MepM/ murein hydrolase activator NlpD